MKSEEKMSKRKSSKKRKGGRPESRGAKAPKVSRVEVKQSTQLSSKVEEGKIESQIKAEEQAETLRSVSEVGAEQKRASRVKIAEQLEPQPRDYTARTWVAALLLVLVLVGVSFIPPQDVFGVELKRANILSEVMSFDDVVAAADEDVLIASDEHFDIDLEEVEEVVQEVVADTIPTVCAPQTTFDWCIDSVEIATTPKRLVRPHNERLHDKMVKIEDFDSTGVAMGEFYRKLMQGTEPVRIAVMGDSFIEGDILTCDLREKLQDMYGGCGAGFAPAASPLTGFRKSVKTTSKGWTSHNIMQKKTTPSDVRELYMVSGWVCRPTVGASVRWEGVEWRNNLKDSRVARLMFVSRDSSTVEITVNDTHKKLFQIDSSSMLRQIVVRGDIRSLTAEVKSGASKFVGYGAIFEGDQGVVVDNYSIRSNNGHAMFGTNPSLNAQANAMGQYDLVILQYGLNIMQAGVTNYTRYKEQVQKMIAYVRQCFPQAAVLVMSVSERCVKNESGSFVTMGSSRSFVGYQRQAAQESGAAFWSTFDAMQSMGGIRQFVAKGWAGKDYTHINFGGGRQVAYALVDALNEGALEYACRSQLFEGIELSDDGVFVVEPIISEEIELQMQQIQQEVISLNRDSLQIEKSRDDSLMGRVTTEEREQVQATSEPDLQTDSLPSAVVPERADSGRVKIDTLPTETRIYMDTTSTNNGVVD